MTLGVKVLKIKNLGVFKQRHDKVGLRIFFLKKNKIIQFFFQLSLYDIVYKITIKHEDYIASILTSRN